MKGGKCLHTCSLRPTGIYGEGHDLMKDFYKQGVRRGGLIIGGVPEHSEHGRVYAGKTADVLSNNCNFNNTSEFHNAASAVSALFFNAKWQTNPDDSILTAGLKAEVKLSCKTTSSVS